MRKGLVVLMMAGGLALSMLSGCGDEQDNTVVEKERGKKEDPDKKDKDDKKTDAEEEPEDDVTEEDQDWQSKYAGYWAEVDGDMFLSIGFNDDSWNIYDMSEEGAGQILSYGNYTCDKDSLCLYDYNGDRISSMYVSDEGQLIDSEDGTVFEYDLNGILSRENEEDYGFGGYTDEELEINSRFEGDWKLEDDDVVLCIYDDYLWAYYNEAGDFMGANGGYKVSGDVITIEFNEEYYDLTLTDPDTLEDLSTGEVYKRIYLD
ncbi:MAG: hypothetical protein IKR23_03465 [Lachnospiraceae bacterium]|nr:hypothetical protein [Lachnospiraceae bacterium]